jgi:hypothetical protein
MSDIALEQTNTAIVGRVAEISKEFDKKEKACKKAHVYQMAGHVGA